MSYDYQDYEDDTVIGYMFKFVTGFAVLALVGVVLAQVSILLS